MTAFQKLFWLFQMGIGTFCDEKAKNQLIKKKIPNKTLQQLESQIQNSEVALSKRLFIQWED